MKANQYIACTISGDICDPRHGIFPLLKQLENDSWQLVGTAFFITKLGLFLTAKHVLEDVLSNRKQIYPIAGFVSMPDNIVEIRPVTKAFFNVRGDVAAGFLANKTTDGGARINPFYGLDLSDTTSIGEKVVTYAYPMTTICDNQINLRADYYDGKIIELHKNGRDQCLLPNACYRTSMNIQGGASGGPVFNHKGKVIAVNSTSYDFDDSESISFVSAIDSFLDVVLEDLFLPESEVQKCTIRDLYTLGMMS
ncbi:MAG: serine protease [bacterium]|nr:serine protease [bacterium]